MKQMYVIFVNEKPLILTNNKELSTVYARFNFDEISFITLIENLCNNQYDGVCIYHESITVLWNSFQSNLKIEHAAGGLVFNKKSDLLAIYRFQKWDLPKGKIEKGESKEIAAMREVEEESGIDKLSIIKSMPTTYHIFKRNGNNTLKITYWFQMITESNKKPIPQVEEGIERVRFFKPHEINIVKEKTYQNILLLLN